MNPHTIFYYPYASFKDEQKPLLKALALYFDKCYILDPLKASWDMIGPGTAAHDLKLLEQENILVRISPEDVLQKYEKAITSEILRDMKDVEFLKLCNRKDPKSRWTLALAKVPEEFRKKYKSLDAPMKRLMGDIPMEVSYELDTESGRYGEYKNREFNLLYGASEEASSSKVFDEYREAEEGKIEYRYADFPLSLGEAIMINHALFGGFLHTGAIPLTDDGFHNKVLNLKIKSARNIPLIKDILKNRAKQRQLKLSMLAMTTFTDLELAIISPKMPMEEILHYRHDNKDALEQAREELALLARETQQKPWSEEFADELESKIIPKIQRMLNDSKKARDSWLKSKRGSMVLKAAGIGLGAAATTVSIAFSATPLMPTTIASGALMLVSGSAIPGIEWLMDWKKGKRTVAENGLHYLFKIKR